MSSKRDYGQFCGLAAGLNVIGERWTLLIIRELLISPARFNEMLDNLPGIGPNLLSERLRSLVDRGIVEQLPVPEDGRAKRYRLTELGQELRQPVLALARWGMNFLAEEDRTGTKRAKWGFLAVQSMIVESEIPDVAQRYEFRVDDETFTIEIQDGQVSFHQVSIAEPDLVIECDADTFIRIGARMLTPLEAIATGDVSIKGDSDAINRCIRMLGLN